MDHFVRGDGNLAGSAELLPVGDEFAIRLQDLDAIVATVGNVDPSRTIKSDAMRRVEFACRLAMLSPRYDERSILSELHDAVIGAGAMSIDDIDVSVGRHHDGADSAQIARAVAGHARLAQNHQKMVVWAELNQVIALPFFAI